MCTSVAAEHIGTRALHTYHIDIRIICCDTSSVYTQRADVRTCPTYVVHATRHQILFTCWPEAVLGSVPCDGSIFPRDPRIMLQFATYSISRTNGHKSFVGPEGGNGLNGPTLPVGFHV